MSTKCVADLPAKERPPSEAEKKIRLDWMLTMIDGHRNRMDNDLLLLPREGSEAL